MRKGIANDPQRKERIAQAALDVLAEGGIRAATHRRIAQRADVPLGSVTYHYASLDDILLAAFELMGEQMNPRYGEPIRAAASQQEACEVLIDAICGDRRATEREMRLHRELYAYASNSTRLQALVRSFEERAIEALASQFPEPAARALDALVEGWWIYQSWHPVPLELEVVSRAVQGIVAAFEADTPDLSQAHTAHKGRISSPSLKEDHGHHS